MAGTAKQNEQLCATVSQHLSVTVESKARQGECLIMTQKNKAHSPLQQLSTTAPYVYSTPYGENKGISC